jgi:hypothetical protein
MPVAVVDRFEAIEIDEQQRQRPPAPRSPLGFAPQHLREISRIVKLRQIVGHRQRFGALHPHGIVEREGGRFECSLEHAERRPLEPRLTRRRHAIDGHQRANRSTPALERQTDRGGRRGIDPQEPSIGTDIRRQKDFSRPHDPPGNRRRRVVERRRQRPGGERPDRPRLVPGQDQPAGGWHPV